jgi:hypothetical protein
MILNNGTAQAIGKREDIIPLLSGRPQGNGAAQPNGAARSNAAAVLEA